MILHNKPVGGTRNNKRILYYCLKVLSVLLFPIDQIIVWTSTKVSPCTQKEEWMDDNVQRQTCFRDYCLSNETHFDSMLLKSFCFDVKVVRISCRFQSENGIPAAANLSSYVFCFVGSSPLVSSVLPALPPSSSSSSKASTEVTSGI